MGNMDCQNPGFVRFIYLSKGKAHKPRHRESAADPTSEAGLLINRLYMPSLLFLLLYEGAHLI